MCIIQVVYLWLGSACAYPHPPPRPSPTDSARRNKQTSHDVLMKQDKISSNCPTLPRSSCLSEPEPYSNFVIRTLHRMQCRKFITLEDTGKNINSKRLFCNHSNQFFFNGKPVIESYHKMLLDKILPNTFIFILYLFI